MMLVDIYGAILKPREEGDYVVLVTVFPLERTPTGMRHLNRSASARTLEEARLMRRSMAMAVRDDVERLGHDVRIVHIR